MACSLPERSNSPGSVRMWLEPGFSAAHSAVGGHVASSVDPGLSAKRLAFLMVLLENFTYFAPASIA